MQTKELAIALVVALGIGATNPAAGYWFKSCSYHSYWSGDTAMVADINPGPADSINSLYGFGARGELMEEYQGALYFQADDSQSGAELWWAAGGTVGQVADLAPGAEDSSPHAFTVFQSQLYFAATTPATGEQLYRFDGNSVSLAAETHPDKDGGRIYGLTVFGSALYFARSAPNGDQQVWRFDGNNAEPVSAINSAPGRIPANNLGQSTFVPFKGALYYVRATPLPEHFELWMYDGTTASIVKALTVGNNIVHYTFDLAEYNSELYFGVVATPDPQVTWQHEDELWRYAGEGNPIKVASLDSAWSSSQPRYFQTFNGKLYFAANSRLYRYHNGMVEDLSSASPDVPKFVRNLSNYPSSGRLYLSGYQSDATGQEPYLFDGAGAHLLKDITPNSDSHPTVAVEGDGLYFSAKNNTHGRELWRASGNSFKVLDCLIVVAPIWDNWLVWPVDVRNVVVATWFLRPEADAQLVSREAVAIRKGEQLTTRVLELNADKAQLPEGFALATVVFDRATGERLDQGFDIVGVPVPRARARMVQLGRELVNARSLEEVLKERIERPGARRIEARQKP